MKKIYELKTVIPDKKAYFLLQTGDQKLTIIPWPFETEKFIVNFEWRLLNQLQFTSSAQFRKEFMKAEVSETTWEVVCQPEPEKKQNLSVIAERYNRFHQITLSFRKISRRDYQGRIDKPKSSFW